MSRKRSSTLFAARGGMIWAPAARAIAIVLTHSAGGGVDEHLVAGLDPRQVLAAHHVVALWWSSAAAWASVSPRAVCGQAGVAGDERAQQLL